MDKEILEKKNCVITGATGGLGKEIAKELARNQCNLILTATNDTKLQELKKEIEQEIKNEIKIVCECVDFSNLEDIKEFFSKIRKTSLSIDILVNCAGVFIIKSISESKLEDFESCFNVNIRAPFMFCKEFSKDMISKKWGRIVNIGSSSSYEGFENGSVYCSSKHAILGLSRALSAELKKYNIRTICVAPSSIQTEMGKLSVDQDFNTFLNPKEIAKSITSLISSDKEMMIDEIRLKRMTMR